MSMTSRNVLGLFNYVKPRKLKAKHQTDEWVFGSYVETPSQREDGLWFSALLFRDKERTIFGALVCLGKELPHWDARQWATRVLLDQEYRDSQVTEDESLVKLWKRH
ncbi:MAG: hypothetical protein LBB76_07520 [Azoarcus sp.]|jgi:hypothetical protein|nr:hypothetical protein [Azoarcus sp.]